MVDNHRYVKEAIIGHDQKVISEVSDRTIKQVLFILSVVVAALAWEEIKLITCEKHQNCSMDH